MHTSRVAQQDTAPSGRRRFLERLIVVVQTTIGGTLGVVLGGAVLSPGLARRAERWLSAGKVMDLAPDTPTAVMLRVARQDGYAQVVERRTVFLVRTGDSTVTALDSTCTHLGCRVSWNPGTKELQCPCHGGRYDSSGAVTGGPPPAPLATFDTKISDGDVLVRV